VKRILIISSAILILGLGASLWIMNNMDRLMANLVESQVVASLEASNISKSRFEVVFCGTGSPQFHPDRSQPCTAVIAGGRLFLFDSGQGTVGQLNKIQAPTRVLETIFLTHLHSDHISGLGETLHNGWLYGRQHLVEVVGPPGTQKMVAGFQQVYADDIAERQRVVGREYLDAQSGMGLGKDTKVEGEQAQLVYDDHGVMVAAFRVEHPDWPYAYGYKLSFGGKTIVISGDTTYSENTRKHAKGADLLIHEAVNMEMMGIIKSVITKYDTGINPDRMDRIAAVHTPTHDLAKLAAEASVDTLVVTHLIPPVPALSIAENYFTEGMEDIFSGELIVARDGMRITLAD